MSLDIHEPGCFCDSCCDRLAKKATAYDDYIGSLERRIERLEKEMSSLRHVCRQLLPKEIP